jgi:hypothetical protein
MVFYLRAVLDTGCILASNWILKRSKTIVAVCIELCAIKHMASLQAGQHNGDQIIFPCGQICKWRKRGNLHVIFTERIYEFGLGGGDHGHDPVTGCDLMKAAIIFPAARMASLGWGPEPGSKDSFQCRAPAQQEALK